MDLDARRQVVEKLREMDNGARSRVVLHVASAPETKNAPSDPEQFSSRAEFRKALIEKKRTEGRDALRELTLRLQALDLTVTAAELSHALLIEGEIGALEAAMSEPEVEAAIPDMPLQAPDAQEETDEESS